MRSHDQRIEDELADLLHLYLPKPPARVHTFIGVAGGENKRIRYFIHEGAPGDAQEDLERVLEGAKPRETKFVAVPASETLVPPGWTAAADTTKDSEAGKGRGTMEYAEAPTTIITGKVQEDGSYNLRTDTVVRHKPKTGESHGSLNIRKTKDRARDMINKNSGKPLPDSKKKRKQKSKDGARAVQQQMQLRVMKEFGDSIRLNLLEKSGLTDDRILRDLNILEDGIREAAYHLNSDELRPALDRHFGLDNLKESDQRKQADGCTIAALLMMNAAMLHQRIANGRWLSGVSDLAAVKNEVNVVRRISREWDRVMRHDFRPVLEPAVEAVQAIEDTGKLAGLERALRHVATEAERIAETYADMGADHAGPLFNRVMGNQASDGAYFTRPVAASIAARLTLDACGDRDWTDPDVWKEHKTLDLACGSGTLLAALLTDVKRRAKEQGATETQITALQKLAVEETIKGLDINPVSLQLAASQLTAGNHNISYRQMGLHLMPYGPKRDNAKSVSVGTLELLGQKDVIPRNDELDLADDKIASQLTWSPADSTELEDAVAAVKDARIIIMNPPFTNRTKVGEKFPKETQRLLRARADAMERTLVRSDRALDDFVDKNSLAPLFVALADKCTAKRDGILTMVHPTIALTNPSGQRERQILAQRFHIHTVLTCHQPGNINMSHNTSINESIIVMRRHPDGPKQSTRFVHLDRMPADESEVEDLHSSLLDCTEGQMANGWGEVSLWPIERIETGDWTPAAWRSPALAREAARIASHSSLCAIKEELDYTAHESMRRLYEYFQKAEQGRSWGISVLESKGAGGQKNIEAAPDGYWIPKKGSEEQATHYLKWASHLLVTSGQRNNTARLTAAASDQKHLGIGWSPVVGVSLKEAKAVSVFVNSTAGRLQLMRSPGQAIDFPTYKPKTIEGIKVPDVKDTRICDILVDCWERTKEMEVPQFRDGDCEVRRLWDESVAEAMGWDPGEFDQLRGLLSNEPHVRGLGYNQYSDEIEEELSAGAEPNEEGPARQALNSPSAFVT